MEKQQIKKEEKGKNVDKTTGLTSNNISNNNKKRGIERKIRRPLKPQRKSEYDQAVLDVRRVTRVVAGGRRFSLSAVVVIGNRKGTVGIGIGKSSDVAQAVKKATADAKKHLHEVKLTENLSIAHEVSGKFCASKVLLFPSTSGVIAGGAVRVIADLAGIKNLNGKIITRSKNHLNNAQATIKALEGLRNKKPK